VPEPPADAVDPQEQFAADFALMTGELTQLLADVLRSLGGEMPIAAAAGAPATRVAAGAMPS
jgi:hypothetical protein